MIYALAIAYLLVTVGTCCVGLAPNRNEDLWLRAPADSARDQIPNQNTPRQVTR